MIISSYDELDDQFNNSDELIIDQDIVIELVEINTGEQDQKEKTAQYKIYNEPQLDIKEKELCTECKCPYNEKELLNEYCNKYYKEVLKCIGCKQPTFVETLKNAKCTICFQMEVEQ
ncbi:18959_t:CDS:2 [Racocetra persica]|uniref:18959_t:CDS:1 n=1 Tax=Racocetra persica TaxID=160502 RepID=A0ACA9L726_9GLOM|nr:18959_t:CDS:2 [Racocetra persica]